MQRGLKSNTIKSRIEIKIVLKYRIFLEYHRVLMMSLYSIAIRKIDKIRKIEDSQVNQGKSGNFWKI